MTKNVDAYCVRPIEVLELSNFLLKNNHHSNVIRPSKLYMKELDLQNPSFNIRKFEKYKYFFIQRKLLKEKIRKKKNNVKVDLDTEKRKTFTRFHRLKSYRSLTYILGRKQYHLQKNHIIFIQDFNPFNLRG